jgi:hypothetical protein
LKTQKTLFQERNSLIATTAHRVRPDVIVFVILTNGSAQTAPRRVIIDTDPGVDDAMAILLALDSPELKVEALTVVPGNVEAAQGLENALKLVSLAGRCDVLVAAGVQHPLNQKLITAQFWHGKNGLAGSSPAQCASLRGLGRRSLCAAVCRPDHGE